ncbi:colicin E3/pyocin S6 family cytotoxin [Pseudomonas sp. GD03842]|uniref:colicin E3/pyocin S6 family cytotoxin n=1 Tax=Pseudomonas sp. GD03842 TaxID=2975385 RepID=UPI00244B22D7|nr:colicin E3/pyocin S6 family cytotoxin [Pseudomonas sp. GD03842]MDH0745854.1 colicin E3/pyocin S6 family cytotoxin [Pseudomonas sp. GD03842]
MTKNVLRARCNGGLFGLLRQINAHRKVINSVAFTEDENGTDQQGNIYEWDFRHSTFEKYSKRGIHLGEYDPTTGVQTKSANPARKIS